MPRLKCLSALASIKCQIAIFGLTNRRHHHTTNLLLGTIGTFRWQVSHIRQPAQEEGRLAAEIGHFSDLALCPTLVRNVHQGGRPSITLNLWLHALERTRWDKEAFAQSGDPLQYR